MCAMEGARGREMGVRKRRLWLPSRGGTFAASLMVGDVEASMLEAFIGLGIARVRHTVYWDDGARG